MSAFPTAHHRIRLLQKLDSLGIAQVHVSFCGSGDSGQIDQIDCLNSQNQAVKIDGQMLTWPTTTSQFNHKTRQWDRQVTEDLKGLGDVIEQVTCDALSAEGLDWYNNDGGQGTLNIDLRVDPPTIQVECGINFMHTEEHSIDLTEAGDPSPEDDEDEE